MEAKAIAFRCFVEQQDYLILGFSHAPVKIGSDVLENIVTPASPNGPSGQGSAKKNACRTAGLRLCRR
jgi:hypothetical protein